MRAASFLIIAAAATAAGCSDASPVAPAGRSLYDLSGVTITSSNTPRPHGGGVNARAAAAPRFICYQSPDGGWCEPRERPLATFDYGPDYYGYSDGVNKHVHIAAWSDNYEHIDNMTLTGYFKSVGGEGPQGCSATPQQFDQETVSGFGTPWGDHYSIWVERNAVYSAAMTFVWEVVGEHTFDASAGYSVDGYANVGTFYSSGRLCT